MSTPRELSRIANRIAGKMTDDGWVSPGRKNLVSDNKVMELIDLIFNEIWRELDDGKRVHIRKQMIFKKIFVSRQKDCLLYTSPSPRDMRRSRMPSSA